MSVSNHRSQADAGAKFYLSPVAIRRRREAKFRYALFNLGIIQLELDRIQKLLHDDVLMIQDTNFSRAFVDARNRLNQMGFFLDCGSFDAARIAGAGGRKRRSSAVSAQSVDEVS